MSATFRKALYRQLRGIVQGVFPTARVYALGSTPTRGTPDRYVTWSRVSSEHARHLTAGASLVADRYDVNVWARKLSDAEQLADGLREQLDNFRGEFGDADELAEVTGSFLEGTDHSFDPPTDGSGVGWHRIRLDFRFWRSETTSPA